LAGFEGKRMRKQGSVQPVLAAVLVTALAVTVAG
jgi:hypothetical protein